jgi:hypothetical protein
MPIEVGPKWKKRIKAPLGIYIWGALVILRFGVSNTVGYYVAIREANGDVYLPLVVVSFALSLFTAGAAIWAMTGDNAGRLALMILTPLNIGWAVLLLIPVFAGDDKELATQAMNGIISQVFVSLWIIAMEWYFMTEKVVEYYKQDA